MMMKFFVPPAGGLFCFRRPQSAPPAKPASRASQQTPSSAFGKTQARRSPSPKVGKAPLSRRTRAPKGSPVLLEEAPPPSQEAPAATKRQSPRPKASGRPPYGKQAVRELRSRPSRKPRQTAVSRMRALSERRKAEIRRPTFRGELRCRKTPQMRGKPRGACREFRAERPRPAGQNRGAKRLSDSAAQLNEKE